MRKFGRPSSTNYGKKKGRFNLVEQVSDIDIFPMELPAFNLKGESRITTFAGGILSILILTLVGMYAAIRGVQLIGRKNPNIVESSIEGYYGAYDSINMKETNQRFAFAYLNYDTKELKDDPRYVKIIARMYIKENGNHREVILPTHRCTDKDYAQFNPLSKRSEGKFKEVRDNPASGFYCFDYTDDMIIGGGWAFSELSEIDFLIAPCNYVHQ